MDIPLNPNFPPRTNETRLGTSPVLPQGITLRTPPMTPNSSHMLLGPDSFSNGLDIQIDNPLDFSLEELGDISFTPQTRQPLLPMSFSESSLPDSSYTELGLDHFAYDNGLRLDAAVGFSTQGSQSNIDGNFQVNSHISTNSSSEWNNFLLRRRGMLFHEIPWFQVSEALLQQCKLNRESPTWISHLPSALGLTADGISRIKVESPFIDESRDILEKQTFTELSALNNLVRNAIYWGSNNLIEFCYPNQVRNELWQRVKNTSHFKCLKWIFKSKLASATAISNELVKNVVSSGDVSLLRLLCDIGADKRILGGTSGGMFLCTAISEGHLEMAQFLIDVGADVSYRNDFYEEGPLHALAKYGHRNWNAKDRCAILVRIVENGVNINEDCDYNSPLLIAALEGDLESLDVFLQHGADENLLDNMYVDREVGGRPPPDYILYHLLGRFGARWHWLQLRGLILAARVGFKRLQQFVSSLEVDDQEKEELLGEGLIANMNEKSSWCRNPLTEGKEVYGDDEIGHDSENWDSTDSDSSNSDEMTGNSTKSGEDQFSSGYVSDEDQSDPEDEQNKYGGDDWHPEWTRSRSLDRRAIITLLKFGANPNASAIPRPDAVQLLTGRKPFAVTALRYAIRSTYGQDRLWKARILQRYGASSYEAGLLEEALAKGNIDLFRCLVKDMENFKLLHAPDILSLLLLKFENPTRHEILENLSSAGLYFDINAATTAGYNPLQIACRHGSKKMAEEVLGLGASINVPLSEKEGLSPLHFAVISGNPSLVQLLLERGAKVHQWPKAARNTLFECWAQSLGSFSDGFERNKTDREKIFYLLLKSGAEIIDSPPWTERNWGACAAHLLKKKVPENFARLVIEVGLDLNSPLHEENSTESPLELAVKSYDLSFVKWLIQKGAQPEVLKKKNLCMHVGYLADSDLESKISFLLEIGVNPNGYANIPGIPGRLDPATGTTLQTICMSAKKETCLKLIPLLLKYGADLNASAIGKMGRTALQAACLRKDTDLELVKFLTKLGADINARPAHYEGLTALQGASIIGDFRLALYLLENGAKVNAAGAERNGRTALEGAAEHGRLDIARMLLNMHLVEGVKVNCTKAIKLAEQGRHIAVVDMLKNWSF
jgi:ankyrin repeat protein